MSVWDRPYAGNYRPNRRKVVRYTPDAVLLLNGDVSVPGNNPEQKIIDIQKYLTQVSVDAGTEAGSASASFTLSIPKTVGSSLFSDGHSVFQPGLEVHIYMRGYLPVEKLPKMLSGPELDALKKVLGDNIENLALRPYYHCFHGVTTTANLEYSGGFYSVNMSCSGMLHFWQYHDISTNASLFGTRPTGSKLKMSLVGHNFTNMTPFSIIYSLYKDTAGAAGGVAFALSSSSNQSKKFFDSGSSLFEMSQLYWERRFQTKMYNLRMFGVNGEMLNTAQTAMVGRMSTKQLRKAAEVNMRHHRASNTQPVEPLRANQTWDQAVDKITGKKYKYRSLSDAMLQYVPRAGEQSGYAVSAAQLKAFVNDIGQWGSVNLWESNYTSKLDIASAAATAVGFEFYQDVDGDLVFKPPLYNMDTRNLPAYNIEPVDIISLTRASAEPQCTYMTVKSGAFTNIKGLGLEGEFGIRGQYIDYRLVAKYGWRPGDLDAQFYSDSRGAFWAAVARLDILNEAMETANITIPLRPELRPGFPVYIQHLDCFFYIKSLSHSFSYGGQCTTSLQCVAQRKKFLPPGDPRVFGTDPLRKTMSADQRQQQIATQAAQANGLKAIKLSRPDSPSVSIVRKNTNGEFYLSGFPNVVMALDPNAVSPLVWALGQDVTDLTNKLDVRNLIALLAGLNNAHPLSQTIESGNFQTMTGTSITGGLVGTNNQGGGFAGGLGTLDAWFEQGSASKTSVWVAAERFASQKATGVKGGTSVWKYLELDLGEMEQQLKRWEKYMEKITKDGQKTASADAVDTATWKKAMEDYDKELIETVFGKNFDFDNKATVFDLLSLVDVVKSASYPEADMLDSAQILDLLGDKKANFSNASTPGYYRYYSSSHPEPLEQGPDPLRMAQKRGGGASATKLTVQTKQFNGEIFCRTDKVLNPGTEVQSPALRMRYVEVDKQPDRNVRTFRIAGAGGTYMNLHTDEIRTFSFTKFPTLLNALVPVRSKFRSPPQISLDSKTLAQYTDALMEYMVSKCGEFDLNKTYGEYIKPLLDDFKSFPLMGELSGMKFLDERQIQLNRRTLFKVAPFDSTVYTRGEWLSKYPSKTKNNPSGWQGNIRLQFADFGSDGVGGSSSDVATIRVGQIKLGQIRRHLGCPRRCRCLKNKRGKTQKVKPADRKDPINTSQIDIDTLRKYVDQDIARRLVRRYFHLLNISLKFWSKKYRNVMRLKNPKGTDLALQKEGIKEYAKFDDYLKQFNTKVGIYMNKSVGKTGYRINTLSMTNSKKFVGKGVYAKLSNMLTPVFPISDEGGYKVFGSYAYGRGVSVGEGGSLEKLMSKDPLEEIDDQIIDNFVRTLLKSGGQELKDNTHFSNKNQKGMIQAILEMQNTNPAAFTRVMKVLQVKEDTGNKVVSVQKILDSKTKAGRVPNDKEMTNLIGNGLINHFMRDDTPGTYTSPTNTAVSLADIMPGKRKGADPTVGDEILWDSMVRLQASDESSFIYVMPEGVDGESQSNVVKTVQQQIAENAGISFPIQDEYRGKKEKPRAKIDFETISQGWGEDSVLADAVDKFQQWGRAFGGEVPDDPQLAAAFGKLESAYMQSKLSWRAVDRGDAYDSSRTEEEKLADQQRERAEYLQSDEGLFSNASQYLGGGDLAEGEETVGAPTDGDQNIVVDD